MAGGHKRLPRPLRVSYVHSTWTFRPSVHTSRTSTRHRPPLAYSHSLCASHAYTQSVLLIENVHCTRTQNARRGPEAACLLALCVLRISPAFYFLHYMRFRASPAAALLLCLLLCCSVCCRSAHLACPALCPVLLCGYMSCLLCIQLHNDRSRSLHAVYHGLERKGFLKNG